MNEKMELAELAQKFRNNASAVLTGDQVADEILNWAADFTIVHASSPAQEPVTTEPVAWIVLTKDASMLRIWWRNKEPAEKWSKERDQPLIPLYAHPMDQATMLPFTLPAPPQPGREEIARIIEARVLGGAAWEEPQASCYRAADAILALTGEPK